MHYNSGGNLPFSATQLQFDPNRVQINPPPYQLEMNPLTADFRGMEQQLTAAIIQEICGSANATPLRMFLFNELASTSFSGPTIPQMIQTLAEYLGLKFSGRGNFDINRAVLESAMAVVNFVAVLRINAYPELMNYVNQGTVMAIRQEYATIAGQIQQIKMNSQQQQQFNNPRQFHGISQQFNGQGFNPRGVTGRSAGITDVGSRVFTNNAGGTTQDNQSSMGMRDFQRSNQNTSDPGNIPKDTQMTQNVNQVKDISPEQVMLDLARKQWQPNELCLYRPAYRPSTQKLVAKEIGPKQFIYTVVEGENNMIEERHKLSALFGPVPEFVRKRASPLVVNDKLIETVADGAKADKNVDICIDNFSRVVSLPHLQMEFGFDNLWVSGLIEHMIRSRKNEGYDPKKPINILQWSSMVLQPILISQSVMDIVQETAGEETPDSIIAMLNDRSALSLDAAALINKRMTDAVNRCVAHNLSVSNGKSNVGIINSFADDWYDLLKYLHTKFGEGIVKPLLLNLPEVMMTTLATLDREMRNNYIRDSFEEIPDGEANLEFFTETVSCTYLNFHSAELDIDFIADTSAMLTKSNTRMFYDLAEMIYKTYGDSATRHFVRTADNKTLEISRGWLNKASYLIALISG